MVVQVLVEDGHRGGVRPLGAGAEDGVDRDTKDGVDRLYMQCIYSAYAVCMQCVCSAYAV